MNLKKLHEPKETTLSQKSYMNIKKIQEHNFLYVNKIDY